MKTREIYNFVSEHLIVMNDALRYDYLPPKRKFVIDANIPFEFALSSEYRLEYDQFYKDLFIKQSGKTERIARVKIEGYAFDADSFMSVAEQFCSVAAGYILSKKEEMFCAA